MLNPKKASTGAGARLRRCLAQSPRPSVLLSAVFSTCCQFLYSGIFGSLNAIARVLR